jgi:hypothetical protein
MNSIKHFVITRIGLGIYNEQRLNKVIDLFEAVTLSSLANQSSQAFFSLIVIDAHMPAGARARIGALLAGRQNFFLVAIDVTRLIHVRAGCFDWVWDHCQDFVLKQDLLDDPNDYVITSNIDADDAWHRDVIGSINSASENRLLYLLSQETGADRATWTSFTAGMVATFERGYQWFISANTIAEMVLPFHSMAIFVTARFSSGISVCSSRHSQWPQYSQVLQFEVGAPKVAQQMWVYGRHDEATVGWNAVAGMPLAGQFELELSATFGIDMDKIQKWRLTYPVGSVLEYSGQRTTRDQYNLIFRIAALNRKIQALRSDANRRGFSQSIDDELTPCEIERDHLIEELQE